VPWYKACLSQEQGCGNSASPKSTSELRLDVEFRNGHDVGAARLGAPGASAANRIAWRAVVRISPHIRQFGNRSHGRGSQPWRLPNRDIR